MFYFSTHLTRRTYVLSLWSQLFYHVIQKSGIKQCVVFRISMIYPSIIYWRSQELVLPIEYPLQSCQHWKNVDFVLHKSAKWSLCVIKKIFERDLICNGGICRGYVVYKPRCGLLLTYGFCGVNTTVIFCEEGCIPRGECHHIAVSSPQSFMENSV